MTIKNNGGIFGRNPTFNNLSVDGNVALGDNKKAIFGAGSDLEISHNGTENVIDSNSGTLVLRSAGAGTIEFRDQGSQVLAQFNDNSSAKLYHNNNEKIATSSSGVSITGNVAFDSGNGIDFSATAGTGTSELFSDYEEGNWSPVLVGSSSAGTATFVSGPNGTYTKIGNQVTVYFSWDISAHTGTGALRVNGLPFTASSATGIGSVMDGNYTYPASRTKLVPYAVGAVIRFYGVGSAVGYAENTLDTSHQMNGTLTYTV
jgi:hypothetical protein